MKLCFVDCALDKCPVYCCLARTTERIEEKLKFDDELVAETPSQPVTTQEGSPVKTALGCTGKCTEGSRIHSHSLTHVTGFYSILKFLFCSIYLDSKQCP